MINDNEEYDDDEDFGSIDWWGAPTVDFWFGDNQDTSSQ